LRHLDKNEEHGQSEVAKYKIPKNQHPSLLISPNKNKLTYKNN
jgi:hypothetical protein